MDATGIALAWVAAASAAAFAAAVVDKARARRRSGARVPERTLLGLALVGGTPGLVVAMLAVRHKTRKRSFLARLAAVIILQCAIVWFILVR